MKLINATIDIYRLRPYANKSFRNDDVRCRLARMVALAKQLHFALVSCEMIHFRCRIHPNYSIHWKYSIRDFHSCRASLLLK